MIKNVYRPSYKVPFVGDQFLCHFNFLDRFSKHPPIPNYKKIRPMGAKLFHVDVQMDRRDEANSRFLRILWMCLNRKKKDES
jgi:hypothetical protein